MFHYGLVGDMSSAALVGTDGSIDWLCLPRFDSPSVFASILDKDVGGRFRIQPNGAYTSVHQAYMQDTNILETTFTTPKGVVKITDLMPIQDGDKDGKPDTNPAEPPELHRIVTCTAGSVEMRCDYQPRHDYARAVPEFRPIRRDGNGIAVETRGGRQTMMLLSSASLSVSADAVKGEFTLSQGESAVFVLADGGGRSPNLERYRTQEKLELTRRYWKDLVAGMHYEGLWREQVVRSFLVLHLMMYRGTGAIVAAPTTSLPETIGGSRNWDYRYSWLRDTSFTVDALYRLGDVYGADHYIHWLLEQCQLNHHNPRILYGITKSSSLEEEILDHLRGYEDSRPVRIGNAAEDHLQLDIYGEVIASIHSLLVLEGEIPEEAWELVCSLAEMVIENWRRRDRGVWEVRGEEQHFVYSKVLCWAALNTAAYIAAAVEQRRHYRRWTQIAFDIKTEVLDLGWSEKKQAFRQRYESHALDASNLAIPFFGFIPREDPRVRQNVDAIERELAEGPLVWRYIPEETDDGLEAQPEGTFTLLSFWLLGNLIYTGQTDRAFDLFHETITRCSNHLDLFAEMYDPSTNRQLGNFPQAYSHIGLIHTALNLSGFIVDTPTRLIRRRAKA
ncbi:MAG: glycoside hydrolase family 15 protein [Dehalococcoidia bacterium]|nr:glycoside hydrolase family 15 protein [Dehalococcoidia bacterium]